MPVFNITEKESQEVSKVTFHKASDYKAVVLKGETTPVLLHKVHADKLISKKLAEVAKDVKVNEVESTMTTQKLEK